jgi:hypothetical protein
MLAGLALGLAATMRATRRQRSMKTIMTVGLAVGVGLGLALAAAPAFADDDETPPKEAAAPAPKEDPPPEKDEATTEKKPKKHHASMGPQGTLFTGAAVSSLPVVLLGYFPVDDLATTVGLGFTYNGNGSAVSPLTGVKGTPNNKVGEDLFLDLIYFVHDQGPFAMGPELNFISSLSPDYAGSVVVLTPMWALRYAPWKAPIAIGTGVGVGFTFQKGMQPVASLSTQGLDLVYAF